MTENERLRLAENERDARVQALNQAAHDCRGNKSAREVVDRAETYLLFLLNADPVAVAGVADKKLLPLSTEELPAFEFSLNCRTSTDGRSEERTVKIWADGRVEGLSGVGTIMNRIPSMVNGAVAAAIKSERNQQGGGLSAGAVR